MVFNTINCNNNCDKKSDEDEEDKGTASDNAKPLERSTKKVGRPKKTKSKEE